MLVVEPQKVLFVEGLDRSHLESLAQAAKGGAPVVGIGAGTVMETAKYVARATGAPLVQVPTTVSNNACFTRAAWTIVEGKRTIARDMPIPRRIVLDPDLLAAAPTRLNRAGIAEILCSHTALHDWRLGHEVGRDVDWDDGLERLARAELRALDATAPLVGANRQEGFRAIFAASWRFAPGFSSHPKARFNAGSEHLFAWGLEALAGRKVLHGEAVGLGVLLMSFVQNNRPDWPARILKTANVAFMPEDIGVTWRDVKEVFDRLHISASAYLWYTVIDAKAGPERVNWPERGNFAAAKNFVMSLK
ncbi:iron-containing alcohol dehydrogenase [Mesorhizobium sp. WSM4887]|uniref:iron-containing alcohol dehydrogenase n=1 Tax=Mesorhizobium sp. WSM4887 TaxID=3038543 RepID=UPI0024162064|nr:iron-containing alcohol dehydrogenase [Mesorhizobium sp. WSM4887]MDG4889749.1 iron-containing alcohol dehydrogenase [Mesorhizobium sp. WSM4887]